MISRWETFPEARWISADSGFESSHMTASSTPTQPVLLRALCDLPLPNPISISTAIIVIFYSHPQ